MVFLSFLDTAPKTQTQKTHKQLNPENIAGLSGACRLCVFLLPAPPPQNPPAKKKTHKQLVPA